MSRGTFGKGEQPVEGLASGWHGESAAEGERKAKSKGRGWDRDLLLLQQQGGCLCQVEAGEGVGGALAARWNEELPDMNIQNITSQLRRLNTILNQNYIKINIRSGSPRERRQALLGSMRSMQIKVVRDQNI
eukprot:4800067-Amphidinium_carterae.2